MTRTWTTKKKNGTNLQKVMKQTQQNPHFLDMQYRTKLEFFEREAFLQATTVDGLKFSRNNYLIFIITFHM